MQQPAPLRAAEVIAVGSELLGTTRVDTNSLYLAGQLAPLGIQLRAKSVVGDDRALLATIIRGALARVVLVILTGGLEAGIAMHVLNNWVAFGLALAFGDMGSALNPTGGSWWSIPVTVTQSLVYLALALFVARRMGLSTRTSPIVLEGPRRRV